MNFGPRVDLVALGTVTRRGVGEFVRAAYVYVLGRPVDAPVHPEH